jgi:hypothetical protein
VFVGSANQAAQDNTEIYLNPQYYYPNGFTVTITPSSAARYVQQTPTMLAIVHNTGATGTLQVEIRAK